MYGSMVSHDDWPRSIRGIRRRERFDGNRCLAGDAIMTWITHLSDAQIFNAEVVDDYFLRETEDTVKLDCWMVGLTDEMKEAARGNQNRDTVSGGDRGQAEKKGDSYVGNLGELAVLEVLNQGPDGTRWEYEWEANTDIVRDGDLLVDVKTRPLAGGYGELLCRRRYRHTGCGGAVVSDGAFDDQNHCVFCGDEGVEFHREDLKSHIYLLVHIEPSQEFAFVTGMASASKVESGVWKTNMEDPAHCVSLDNLDNPDALLGWA